MMMEIERVLKEIDADTCTLSGEDKQVVLFRIRLIAEGAFDDLK